VKWDVHVAHGNDLHILGFGNQVRMNHGKTDRIWTISPASKIEGEAVRQLERAGSLPGMLRAVGLPDLHPGKGAPVGAAFFTDGMAIII
jgi:RNA-splicing ligase RtcB